MTTGINWIGGAESGSGFSEFQSTSGTGTFSRDAFARSGDWAFKFLATTTQNIYGETDLGTSENVRHICGGFAYTTKSGNAAGEPILALTTSGGTVCVEWRLLSSGKIAAYNSAGTKIAESNTVLQPGRYYWLGFHSDASADVVSLQIDGEYEFYQVALVQSASELLRVGKWVNRNGTSQTIYWDDLIATGGQTDFPVEGRVAVLRPTGAGDPFPSTWSGTFADVDDEGDSDTSYMEDTAFGGVVYLALQNLEDVGIEGTVYAYRPLIVARKTDANAATINLFTQDADDDTQHIFAEALTTSYATYQPTTIAPSTAEALPHGYIDEVEIGWEYNSGTSAAVRVSAACLLIYYAEYNDDVTDEEIGDSLSGKSNSPYYFFEYWVGDIAGNRLRNISQYVSGGTVHCDNTKDIVTALDLEVTKSLLIVPGEQHIIPVEHLRVLKTNEDGSKREVTKEFQLGVYRVEKPRLRASAARHTQLFHCPDLKSYLVGNAVGSEIINEKQRITVKDATGGTYTLTLGTQTTGNINYNASAANIETALEALSNVGAGNTTVRVAPGGTDRERAYVVTFDSGKAGTPFPKMRSTVTNLTGDNPSVTIRRTQRGSSNVSYVVPSGTAYISSLITEVLDINDFPVLRLKLPEDTSVTPTAFAWEPGTEWAKVIDDALIGVNYYKSWFDYEGYITSRAVDDLGSRGGDVKYHTGRHGMVIGDYEIADDDVSVYNQITCVSGNPDYGQVRVVVTNRNPDSIVSVDAIGRIIPGPTQENPHVKDSGTLTNWCKGKLQEFTADMSEEITFDTPIDPRRKPHEYYDLDLWSGTNAIQLITFNYPTRVLSSGTASHTDSAFKVSFRGETSDPIKWDAPAADVQAALEAVITIGTGNVLVRGGPGPSLPYEVEFIGQLGGQYIELLDVEEWSKSNSFDHGTNAATISAANSGNANGDPFDAVSIVAGGTFVYDNTRSAHGSGKSAKLATAGTAGTVYGEYDPGVSLTEIGGRVYLYLTANPAATLRFLSMIAGGTTCASFEITTTGKIQARDGTGTLVGPTTASIGLNQWVRVDFYVSASAGAAVITFAFFNTPDGLTETENRTGTLLTTAAFMNEIRFGITLSTANVANYWMDDIVFNYTESGDPEGASKAGPFDPLEIASIQSGRGPGPAARGIYRVKSWTMPLKVGAMMRHVVSKAQAIE